MSYKHDKAMKRLIARRKAYRKALAKGAAGMNENETLRLIIMRPYRRGPVFSLRTWDTGRTDRRGSSIIGYRLLMDGRALFEGADFRCSPMDADDSDASMAALMSFLTLRPGDTDQEYFENYTQDQLEYCDQHAEALSCYCAGRFGGEEN